MPLTRAQAKEICTKAEYELVEQSFSPAVTTIPASRLRSKIERSRKLQDKYQGLARKQNRAVKGERSGAGSRGANARTERKARLFEETRERFEKRLAKLDGEGNGG